jgi:ankyrin repeat protein
MALAAKELIHFGADVNMQGGWYGSAINAVAAKGDCELASLLLSKKALLCYRTVRGETSVALAIKGGDIDMLKLLVDNGADLVTGSGKGLEGFPVLHLAAGVGEPEMVRTLLDLGADLTARWQGVISALSIAANYNHLAVARLLLARLEALPVASLPTLGEPSADHQVGSAGGVLQDK